MKVATLVQNISTAELSNSALHHLTELQEMYISIWIFKLQINLKQILQKLQNQVTEFKNLPMVPPTHCDAKPGLKVP